MRPPKVTKTIVGPVPVVLEPDMPNDDLGEFSSYYNRIRLHSQQAPEQMKRTLLHELAHHMVFHLGLRNVLDKSEEEIVADVFAAYVLGLIRDNAQLVEYLRERV